MCAKRATPALSSIVTTFGQPGHNFFFHFTRSILKGVSACPDTLDDSRPVVSDRLVCSGGVLLVVDHLLGGHQRRYHVTFLEYPSSYSSGGTSRSKSTLIRRKSPISMQFARSQRRTTIGCRHVGSTVAERREVRSLCKHKQGFHVCELLIAYPRLSTVTTMVVLILAVLIKPCAASVHVRIDLRRAVS